jgi:hypothetical protein
MKILINVLHELAGLFVEDRALALGILFVVMVATISTVLIPNIAWVNGAILLFGCLVVLLLNVMKARRN